ncbi:hypothetical protein ACIPL1_16345, partial [Pseudomonas sp. NPDC090202]|uniref:hypothetical protein n=1 Tax=unclassified Pseudomonas TaxID=196821 RepID=UPI003830D483
GPAANGPSMAHAALAASMPLGPLRIACVRPSGTGPQIKIKIQSQIKSRRNTKPLWERAWSGPHSDEGVLGIATADKPDCYRVVCAICF